VRALVATCDRFGILGNILGITTANASNIDQLLDCFEEACHDRGIPFDKSQQHMRCMAHVANLAAQTLLDEMGAEASDGDASPKSDTTAQAQQLPCIAKLRHLVFKLHSSPQHRNEFETQCVSCGIPRKEIILDTHTRWNSTHAMIKRACELRIPLSELAKTRRDLFKLSDKDWKLLEAVAQVLSIFDFATRKLNATSYPTLNSALLVYNHLIDELEDVHDLCDGKADGRDDEADSQDDEVDSQDDEADSRKFKAFISQCSPTMKCTLKKAIQAARNKMCEYYEKTWADMYAVSLILDPRLKVDYCEDRGWEPDHLKNAQDAIQRAVKAYEDAMPRSDQTNTADCLDPVERKLYQSIKRRRVEKESETRRYLAAPTADSDVDVLEWWKLHASEYSCLARIARDYLAIPATSVPAERVLSGGADLITKKRGSLSENSIRACMCLKSWL